MGYYHQNERDMAVGAGICLIVFVLLLLFCVSVAIFATRTVAMETPLPSNTDGSTSNANVVTLEELEAQNVT